MITKKTFRKYLFLLIGVFCIGFGIALAKRSGLGVSPVSSLANILSIQFPVFSVGTWLIFWNFFMVVLQILILRQKFRPIQFIQFPISLALGSFTDLSLLVVSHFPVVHYGMRLVAVVLGIVILSFGIVLMLLSNTVMNVGESLVKVLAQVFGTTFGTMKVLFDIACVILSVALSLLFFDGSIVGIREGTILTACCTGLIVKLLMKWLRVPIQRFIHSKT